MGCGGAAQQALTWGVPSDMSQVTHHRLEALALLIKLLPVSRLSQHQQPSLHMLQLRVKGLHSRHSAAAELSACSALQPLPEALAQTLPDVPLERPASPLLLASPRHGGGLLQGGGRMSPRPFSCAWPIGAPGAPPQVHTGCAGSTPNPACASTVVPSAPPQTFQTAGHHDLTRQGCKGAAF